LPCDKLDPTHPGSHFRRRLAAAKRLRKWLPG
jgi:hypothetical protein